MVWIHNCSIMFPQPYQSLNAIWLCQRVCLCTSMCMYRVIDLTFRCQNTLYSSFSSWTFCAENVTSIVSLPQIVPGTILSLQMDLAGQHRVQVVGHVPSRSVELCRWMFWLVIYLLFFNRLYFWGCYDHYYVVVHLGHMDLKQFYFTAVYVSL